MERERGERSREGLGRGGARCFFLRGGADEEPSGFLLTIKVQKMSFNKKCFWN